MILLAVFVYFWKTKSSLIYSQNIATGVAVLLQLFEYLILQRDHWFNVSQIFLIVMFITVLMAQIFPSFSTSQICPNEPSPILSFTLYYPILLSYSFSFGPSIQFTNCIQIDLQLSLQMGKKNNSEYEVKDVIQYEIRDGKEYFLVWWEGYTKNQATWQPIENMIFLQDYEEYYQDLKMQYSKQQQIQNQKQFTEIDKHKQTNRPTKLRRQIKQENENEPLNRHHSNNSKHILKDFSHKIIQKQLKTPEKKPHNHKIYDINQARAQQKAVITKMRTRNNHSSGSKLKKYEYQNEHIYQEKEELFFDDSSEIQNEKDEHKIDSIAQKLDNFNLQGNVNNQTIAQTVPMINKINMRQNNRRYVRQSGRLVSMNFQIKIKQIDGLTFFNQQLARIKGCFYDDDNSLLYEVEFANDDFKEPVILHQNYLKMLWPRQYAEYLLSKRQIISIQK